MNYNKIMGTCAVIIVLLIAIAIYFFGNISNIQNQVVTEEVTTTPTEI